MDNTLEYAGGKRMREVELLKGMAAEPMWQFDKTGADTIQTPRGSWNAISSVLIGFTRLVNMV